MIQKCKVGLEVCLRKVPNLSTMKHEKEAPDIKTLDFFRLRLRMFLYLFLFLSLPFSLFLTLFFILSKLWAVRSVLGSQGVCMRSTWNLPPYKYHAPSHTFFPSILPSDLHLCRFFLSLVPWSQPVFSFLCFHLGEVMFLILV